MLKEDSEARAYSDHLYEVVFTPLLERPEYIESPMYEKLLSLRNAMGEEDFNTYINSLVRMTYNGSTLWLITNKERHRTIIEGKYLSIISHIFEAKVVRIFSQP